MPTGMKNTARRQCFAARQINQGGLGPVAPDENSETSEDSDMPAKQSTPVWRSRFQEIDSQVVELEFSAQKDADQDAEWCEVTLAPNRKRRVRFHDYHEIYRVPGFYETLFYDRLGCTSPSRVAELLEDVLDDRDINLDQLRVLDVGAGNGMVGDELAARGTEHLVGIDIIPEARDAQRRDRPDLYDGYFVADLTDLAEKDEEQLRDHKCNCLVTVAALGFGDIPAEAFIKGLDLVETPAWLAFNIKEDFLDNRDKTGFSKLIDDLADQRVIRIHATRRYRHRYSMTGKPLHYVAVVAEKLRDVPDELLEKG